MRNKIICLRFCEDQKGITGLNEKRMIFKNKKF